MRIQDIFLIILSTIKMVNSDAECEEYMELLTDVFINSPDEQCATGWRGYKGHCYLFSLERKDWQQAEAFCVANGANLAKVETDKENDWIHLVGSEGYEALWLGGNAVEKEGKWYWSVDDSRLSYKPWDINFSQPDGGTNENCLSILGTMKYGKWNDDYCSNVLRFVCEKLYDCLRGKMGNTLHKHKEQFEMRLKYYTVVSLS